LSSIATNLSARTLDYPVSSVNGKTGAVVLKISDFINDKGYLTSYTEFDPVFAANSGKFVLNDRIT
jgi:hypothetical protein